MRSVCKLYGHHRMFDREDFDTKAGKKVVKKRAHKRLRRQLAVTGSKSIEQYS